MTGFFSDEGTLICEECRQAGHLFKGETTFEKDLAAVEKKYKRPEFKTRRKCKRCGEPLYDVEPERGNLKYRGKRPALFCFSHDNAECERDLEQHFIGRGEENYFCIDETPLQCSHDDMEDIPF